MVSGTAGRNVDMNVDAAGLAARTTKGSATRRNVDMNVDTAGLAARATTGSLNQG